MLLMQTPVVQAAWQLHGQLHETLRSESHIRSWSWPCACFAVGTAGAVTARCTLPASVCMLKALNDSADALLHLQPCPEPLKA